MYNYKKDDSVYLLKRENGSGTFTGFEGVIKDVSRTVKGVKRFTVSYLGDNEIVFRGDQTCVKDMYVNSFYLFPSEKEADQYLDELEKTQMMKEKIEKIIQSKCTFEELEQIYLFLEARYPHEMR